MGGITVDVEPGKYVVAVSGGVDSVALLDLLVRQGAHELVVAHFDHGIREDSDRDYQHVKSLAGKYSIPFYGAKAELGQGTSEAVAREQRYKFLRDIQAQTGASAIVTAHHHDDVLETMVINLLRGTGRRGLSSLKSIDGIIRPLTHLTKGQLIDYAHEQGLTWHEDSTNTDPQYLRNIVRHRIMPKFGSHSTTLAKHHVVAKELNQEIDSLLGEILAWCSNKYLTRVERNRFVHLPHVLAREVLASILAVHGCKYDRKSLERQIVKLKTAKPGSLIDIDGWRRWRLDARQATLEHK